MNFRAIIAPVNRMRRSISHYAEGLWDRKGAQHLLPALQCRFEPDMGSQLIA